MGSQITFGFYESQVDSFGFADLSICSPDHNGRQSKLSSAVASVNATVSSQVAPIIRGMEYFNTVFDNNTVFDMWLDKFFLFVETLCFMILMSPVYFELYIYMLQRRFCVAYADFLDVHSEGVYSYCLSSFCNLYLNTKDIVQSDTVSVVQKVSYCLSEINCVSSDANEMSQKIYNQLLLGSQYPKCSLVFSENILGCHIGCHEQNTEFSLFLRRFVKRMLIDAVSCLFFVFNSISLFSIFTSKSCQSRQSKLSFYIMS